MTARAVRTAWVAVAVVLLLAPASARAQEEPQLGIWDLTRKVLIDPTTYGPAAISYGAIRWDWKTSQVLFEHGWLEANPRFTLSGRPNDVPVACGAGTRIIRGDALSLLQNSVVNNLAVGIGERLLAARYPSRGKLIRTLSWIERVGFASIITYRNSAEHVRQARMNHRLARQYGYIAP